MFISKILFVGLLLPVASYAALENANMANSGWYTTSTSELDNNSSIWHISKVGLNKAWDISTGYSAQKIGIIDTGIDGSHTDLSSRVNAYYSHSWSPNPGDALSPIHWHGTCVAGILGAKPNNGYAVGADWDSTLVSLRADGPAAGVPANGNIPYLAPYEEDWDSVVDAINYSESNGIKILNFSGGFVYEKDSELYEAIDDYSGLIVCAAGNHGQNLGTYSVYPGAYGFDNVIVVGASTQNDTRVTSSNYGSAVDLFAPGEGIVSSALGGGANICSQTSSAAPIVAGTAALMKSINLGLTPSDIKTALISTVDIIPGLNGLCSSGGRLNAFEAIKSVIPTYTSFGSYMASPNGVRIGRGEWYKFTVASGYYEIRSEGTCPVSGKLYSDPSSNPISQMVSGSGSGQNFALVRYLSAGTYYLRTEIGATASSTTGIRISNHAHVYDDHYVWENSQTHRAYCHCGSNVIQAHAVIPSAPTVCVLCGGTASGGIVGPDGSFGTGPLENGGTVVTLNEEEYLFHLNYGDITDWLNHQIGEVFGL